MWKAEAPLGGTVVRRRTQHQNRNRKDQPPVRSGQGGRGGDSGSCPAGQTHAPTLAGRLCGSVSNLTLLQSRWQCLPEARTIGQFREIIRQTVPWGSPVQSKAYKFFTPVPPPATSKMARIVPTLQMGAQRGGNTPLPSQSPGSDRPGFTFRSVCLLIAWFHHQCVDRMDIYGPGNL